MKRVLIVAYYFPPIAASGAVRPLSFCRHLSAFGWMPRVLTTDPASPHPAVDVDHGLSAKLPPWVRVDRVPHSNLPPAAAMLKQQIGRWMSADGMRRETSEAAPLTACAPPLDVRRPLSALKHFVARHAYEFPDHQATWLRPAVRRAVATTEREPVDAVIATGSPWTGLMVGLKIASELRVPFLADFRDPWTRNPYGAWQQLPLLLRRARRTEQRICGAASWVIANTDELREQFASDYPDFRSKFVTITNGFDDWMTGAPDRMSGTGHGPRPAADRELWHFGSVYGKRDPMALLAALRALSEEGIVGRERFLLRFVGPWDVSNPTTNQLAKTLEARGLLVRQPPVSHDECLRQMRAAPALLVLQPSSPLQIPAKIYEYIAMSRPLVVVGGEGATAALVRKFGLGACWPNRVEDLKSMIREVLIGDAVPRPAAGVRAHLHYRELTRRLASCLDEAVGFRASA